MFKFIPLVTTFSAALFSLSLTAMPNIAPLSSTAKNTADYAAKTYNKAMVSSLAALVKHNTVAVKGVSANDNPEHIAFKAELKKQAQALGLDFTDDGYVVIIGLGNSEERVGIITHGDIQPVNPQKWAKSPFELDSTTEPGKLIARGTEDDKGPISTAMYAMKAIKDQQLALTKRIELYVYMAEESDWSELQKYVKNNSLPQTNITIDAEYPVVTAEKGYGTISLTFPWQENSAMEPYISEFSGGFFGSQIPEDAKVVIENSSVTMLDKLMRKANKYQGIGFDFTLKEQQLTVTALGKSAHSSKPEDGFNAITHLADLLTIKRWPNNTSGALVNFINDHLGTGLYGEKFGDIAYQDSFMGKMTVSPTVIKKLDSGLQLNINIRRPQGKSKQQLLNEIDHTLTKWQALNLVTLDNLNHYIGDPWLQNDAPQVDTLLKVFSHYTGVENPQPIAIGGGTNSRLFPRAVSFGPSMPNTEYTGHSEHEFITIEQFVLNLKMYTAVLVELTK